MIVFLLEKKLIKQGWKSFLSLSKPVYIDLVKKFYSNLVFFDGVLRSTVKEVQIILNATRLGRFLQMLYEGSYLDKLSKKKLDLELFLGEMMWKIF